jgi:hypothetical protein
MALSRRPQLSGPLIRVLLLAAAVSSTIGAQVEAAGAIPLQLEVIIEGKATGRIAGFDLFEDGRRGAAILPNSTCRSPRKADQTNLLSSTISRR